MSRRAVFVLAASLALGGCCFDGCYMPPPTGPLASWDGLGPMPKPFHAKLVRVKAHPPAQVVAAAASVPSEADLANLKPYTKEWSIMLNAINRAADEELMRKLEICQGCLPPPQQDDRTGAIGYGGYLPARP
jgi:hypothetical protein